ncbi:MAG: tRNA uridine-5-carboxymethylaminomethyl(34) synthesis GTPase MnmE [Prevotella sp.]
MTTTAHTLSQDTICAIATAQGGAIGVIRISGAKAISIADSVFIPCKGKPLSQRNANTVTYGCARNRKGEIVDEVLVSLFRSPHSYTGEDAVEISCHGSQYILNSILQLLIDQGCRMACAGEYTQRAFLNGKMDLSQAEAVADLIASTNKATHRMAMGQLRGNVSDELSALRDKLLKLTSLLELELDFSDHEELEFADRDELLEIATAIDGRITALAHSFAAGNAMKNGIPVAIVGKTNVGKSTLLNRLVGEERAIVSNIHGTTRDVIEDTAVIHGITFRLIDTAGLRNTLDEIERIGIGRSYRKIDEAAVVMWLVDTLPAESEIDEMTQRCRDKQLIVVNSKTDLNDFTGELRQQYPHLTVIGISARQGRNIPDLQETIYKSANLPQIHENDVIITSARHYEALCHAHDSISRVIEGLDMQLSGDLLSEDLRICLDHLADITGGAITPSETLSNIFSHFCIGK